jgi:hypothetical protein
MKKDDLVIELEAEWIVANNNDGCNCSAMSMPPCSFCTDGYSVSMEEFVELRLLEEGMIEPSKPSNTAHDDYDRAMEGLF